MRSLKPKWDTTDSKNLLTREQVNDLIRSSLTYKTHEKPVAFVPKSKVDYYKALCPELKVEGLEPLYLNLNYFQAKYQKQKPLGNRGKKNIQYKKKNGNSN